MLVVDLFSALLRRCPAHRGRVNDGFLEMALRGAFVMRFRALSGRRFSSLELVVSANEQSAHTHDYSRSLFDAALDYRNLMTVGMQRRNRDMQYYYRAQRADGFRDRKPGSGCVWRLG